MSTLNTKSWNCATDCKRSLFHTHSPSTPHQTIKYNTRNKSLFQLKQQQLHHKTPFKNFFCNAIIESNEIQEEPPETTKNQNPQKIALACKDSDICENHIHQILSQISNKGDVINFIHVMSSDERLSTYLPVNETISYDTYLTDVPSADLDDDSPINMYMRHLKEIGTQMIKRRFLKYAQNANIKTEYHLPILKIPESAAEIGSVLCDMTASLGADMLALVTQKHAMSSFGSVSHYCYENINNVPLLLIPSYVENEVKREFNAKDTLILLCIIDSEDDKKYIDNWANQKFKNKVNIKYVWSNGGKAESGVDLSQLILEETKMLNPDFLLMVSQADKNVLEEVFEDAYVPKVCSVVECPAIILPKQSKS